MRNIHILGFVNSIKTEEDESNEVREPRVREAEFASLLDLKPQKLKFNL